MQHERNRQSVTVKKLQILERLKSQRVVFQCGHFYSAFRLYFPCVTLVRVFRCPNMGDAIVK